MTDKLEQQLREKIASQKAALAEFPSSLTSIVNETGLMSPVTKAWAQLIKELADDEEELELLLESRRVEAVISLQDEMHPPEDSGDCPICLETIKHVTSMNTNRLFCFGGWICKQCVKEREASRKDDGFDEMFSNKCPLCRERLATDKEARAMLLKHSNKGKAWAQVLNASWCFNPTLGEKNGISFDDNKRRELIEQAADQGDPHALFLMSTKCVDVEMKSHYSKRAADLGFLPAQYNLALFYSKNQKREKYIHYLTLAASQGYPEACGALGNMFMNAEWGMTKSFILAKHYAGKSLDYDLSVYNFSFASLHLGKQRYKGIVEIPGHSPIPTFLFWTRRLVEGDLPVKTSGFSVEMKDFVIKQISMVEKHNKSRCANCMKEAGCSSFK
eukprot:CAMPEP_0201741218 /NCGR_PEP_ID=MMETSP0593-20130828/46702_1 /ASSEMBLY_ACC=CAM_ASM_000672 /TAXON_ID=267983 /ORGANISM="Skeletonema japonicum, Strain CCMP2506" /LENGTH=387 /DNA_ID=CAMNT_0048235549 /DNA_START=75 /DNA_END=1235 /DNA_ORIENTATION=-